MPANRYASSTEGESALVAATNRTVLQMRGVTGANPAIIAWGISFDGILATDPPVQVRLLVQSADGTATAVTNKTPIPVGVGSLMAAALAGVFKNFTSTEPTAGAVLEHYEIHPQGGSMVREYPPGREMILAAATTNRIAIECLAGAAVNCVAWMQWEE